MARRHIGDIWADSGAATDPGSAKIQAGWVAEKPSFQKINWIDNRQDEMLDHLETHGIAIWDVQTDYVADALALGSDGIHYLAVQANVGIDPVSDGGTNWVPFIRTATETVAGVLEVASFAETTAGSANDKIITPARLSALVASVGGRGIIEIASLVDALALTDPSKAITPALLGALTASTTQRGILSLASTAETLAGVVADKAVTPQSLGALASSLAPNGYQTLPGGLILQWGTINFTGPSTGVNVPLPISFPTNFFASSSDGRMILHVGGGLVFYATSAAARQIDLSTIQVGSAQAGDVKWFAVGN